MILKVFYFRYACYWLILLEKRAMLNICEDTYQCRRLLLVIENSTCEEGNATKMHTLEIQIWGPM